MGPFLSAFRLVLPWSRARPRRRVPIEMDRDLRKRMALLKLDLYCKGMRLDDSFAVESQAGRKLLRTRAGLGSGLEIVLPGGFWTNVPVRERFAADSPYSLHAAQDGLTLRHDELGPVTRVALAPRPRWYDRTTTTGKPMTHVGSVQGTYLGIYPAKVCDYWLMEDKEQCRFCSVGLNLGADDADEKSVTEVLEVVLAAREESGIT